MRRHKGGDADAIRYGFLLLHEFPLYAIEALRIANQNRGRKLYVRQLISVNGEAVKAGNGMSLTVEASIGDIA